MLNVLIKKKNDDSAYIMTSVSEMEVFTETMVILAES